jgi:16S rRNA G966 N2-methylase RsmD
MTQFILEDFDFTQLNSPDFKEDSVREILILPILQQLGYDNQHIVRSKSLQHPFLKIGSKKRKIKLIPDYLLKVVDNYAWVLDAKAPTEEIKTGEHIEQVYSYAIHPEVRTKYFALCNGYEFVLFRQDTENPVLSFHLAEIQYHWQTLQNYLAPSAFQSGKHFVYETVPRAKSFPVKEADFDYLNRPLLDELPVKKQSAKRHFGVHGYFTKQSWNVVQEYIRHFSRPNDLVLDPFGGSGVTAIEAMMIDRRAIHLDLNPMSFFLVDSLAAPVDLNKLGQAFEQIKNKFEKKCPTADEEIVQALEKYPYPQGIILPKSSDVDTIEQLFSPKQLAQLAFLKHLILKQHNENIIKSLLLAFSSTLNVSNLTTHAGKSGGPNSGAFAYYRYRIAKEHANLSLQESFRKKYTKVIQAKREIQSKINAQTIDRLQILKGTATDLSFLKNESVDYIYTDPPYGKKIPYLDLSVMWNGWLDLPVTEEDYALEAIEGGEHDKTKMEYNSLIAKSIEEMYRVLKFDRWMSFVFAHKDPEFWHLIIDTAERCGFEYAGAVKQSNGQSSFKKRQNPFTVLSGQLIINFKKIRQPKTILKANLGMNIGEIILQTIEGVIAKHHGATLEQINDELIIKGLELGFLDLLKKEYSDLSPLLMQSFDYEDQSEKFRLRKNTQFKTSIDERLRIKYYLFSFLRRAALEKKYPTFDEIVLHIMPLLKNGTTPENQTILSVLEDIAIRIGEDKWKLQHEGQGELSF